MRIIEIEALENGAHRNQAAEAAVGIPEGWAVIPDELELPVTFPFVNIIVEEGTVTAMTAGTVPEPTPEPEPEPEGSVWDELAEAIRSGVNEV